MGQGIANHWITVFMRKCNSGFFGAPSRYSSVNTVIFLRVIRLKPTLRLLRWRVSKP